MEDNNQQDDQSQNGRTALDQLQIDLDSAMNGWKRAAADFDNYKKRSETEKKELLEFAKELTVVKLLPTIDALEQALRHLPQLEDSGHSDENSDNSGRDFEKQYENWQTGVNGIIAQLDKALGELGVRKIEAIGKKFDPHFHEAVKEVESEADDGIVVDEFQTGFELNGKVIRPSQVVISKKKSLLSG